MRENISRWKKYDIVLLEDNRDDDKRLAMVVKPADGAEFAVVIRYIAYSNAKNLPEAVTRRHDTRWVLRFDNETYVLYPDNLFTTLKRIPRQEIILYSSWKHKCKDFFEMVKPDWKPEDATL